MTTRFCRLFGVLLILAACSEKPGPPAPNRSVFFDLPVAPSLEVKDGWEPLEGSVCKFVDNGVAVLGVQLPVAPADVYENDHVRRYNLTLPFGLVPLPRVDEAQLLFPGRELERVRDAVPVNEMLKPSYRLNGRQLVVVHPLDWEPVAKMEVVYSVYASLLWDAESRFEGDELLRNQPREELFQALWSTHADTGPAYVVPTGTTLRVSLPAFARGRVTLRLRPSCTAIDRRPLDVRVKVHGESESVTLEPNGAPASVALAIKGGREGTLEVQVSGQPGELVFVEMPHFMADAEPARAAPNVLFIIIDTLRADRLGVQGNTDGLTPNLDRFASESLRFSEAWAAASWTLSSTATMLTSNHGGQHRAWQSTMSLGLGIDTLPEIFRRRGYRTAARTAGGYVGRNFGFQRGFLWYDDSSLCVEDTVEFGDEFIAEYDDAPWFLLLHTYEVHGPYDPPQPAFDRVVAEHPGALRGLPADNKAFTGIVAENGGVVPPEIASVLEALYDEEVRHMDSVLGEFFDRLRADGRFDDTVIVVTSDHGEEFGEHGLLGHSDSLYSEQLAVPFLLHLPGGERAGEVDHRHVSQLDLAPTVVAAAGLEEFLPFTTFAGVSLLGGETPSEIYATRMYQNFGLLQAARFDDHLRINGRYRWNRKEKGGEELYNLETDPLQADNLVSEDAERAEELGERLKELGIRYGTSRVESEVQIDVEGGTRAELIKLGYIDD